MKTIESMGFRRWTDVDTRFTQAVSSLVLHSHPERLEIQQAFWQQLPDMRLVLFELVDKKVRGSNVRSSMLAVYRPGIDLPEFRLFPHSTEFGDGRQADAIRKDMTRLLDFALEKFGEREIDFTDQPEPAERFTIIAQNEERARSLLTPERIQRLLSLPQGTVLQAGSDLILIGRLSPVPRTGSWEEILQEKVDVANQVAQILLF